MYGLLQKPNTSTSRWVHDMQNYKKPGVIDNPTKLNKPIIEYDNEIDHIKEQLSKLSYEVDILKRNYQNIHIYIPASQNIDKHYDNKTIIHGKYCHMLIKLDNIGIIYPFGNKVCEELEFSEQMVFISIDSKKMITGQFKKIENIYNLIINENIIDEYPCVIKMECILK